MKFLDALEDFSNSLPDVLDDLKDLDNEFQQLASNVVQEGVELFTIGFQEMVVNDNNDWNTTFENKADAQRLIDGVDENYPAIKERLAPCRTEVFMVLEKLEQSRNRCVDCLDEIHSNLEKGLTPEDCDRSSLLSRCRHETYTTAVGKIRDMNKQVFQPGIGFLSCLTLTSDYTPSLWIEDVIKQNKASIEALEAVRTNVNDFELLQVAMEAEISCLNNLMTPSKKALELFNQMEKDLALRLLNVKTAIESQNSANDQTCQDTPKCSAELQKSLLLATEILCESFLGEAGMQVNQSFQKIINAELGLNQV
ncbi:MAG: hypothetical protein B6I36_09755 [Desulfobacteraceae bacterium 4572_35.1]|nr:MAG: hypothetical protein B6I36_09755 [Desulfobacteraceae bacterium 4572_35.1]